MTRPSADDESHKVIATNRKAFFNYEIFEKAEAGIALVGSEVKSIREGGLNFRDSFVDFRGGELWLVGCRIGPYSHGNIQNHSEGRDRKLLLHRREIGKLGGKASEKGYTIVPLQAYFKNGRSRSRSGWPAARSRTTSASRSSARTSSATPARPCASGARRATSRGAR
jgi:SsrA-binding protein